ncbi:hypothetical protein E4U43_000940 [Claviceps pusilla]|uniref:Serine/threonine-protein kinase ppk6 n=1 Tax=Claviceps pusilla TaxID=123648 RepID=A0A9P7NB20_9HYPO|nr:hypothetical protein E4U43_000940 [Claviceps pusilla]
MSADLFAEFCNPPPSSTTTAQPNRRHGDQHQPQTQNTARLVDSFTFTAAQEAGQTSNPVPAWSSFPSSSNAMSGWSQNFVQSQPAANASGAAGGRDGDDDDDDDGWGDFEAAEETTTPATLSVASFPAQVSVSTAPGWNPHSFVSNSQPSRMKEVMTNGLISYDPMEDQFAQKSESKSFQRESKSKIRVKATPSDPNVLFDADDFELHDGGEDDDELDDFGDFEEAESQFNGKSGPAGASSASSTFDLLGLDDPPVHFSSDSVVNENPHVSKSPFSFGAMSTATKSPTTTQSSLHPSQFSPSIASNAQPAAVRQDWPSKVPSLVTAAKKYPAATSGSLRAAAEDDEWASWDDFPGANGGSSTIPASKETDVPKNTAQGWDWDEGEEASCFTSVNVDRNSPPPTNVPPPAILLSTFPELFSSGDSLFKPLSGQTTTIKQQVLANPKTVNFLSGYILIATTAARIIAGRKHRWHRDKLLAKSMSISAAGSKGMKLAGVDKTQSAREDREAADVVTAWKEYVGRLRSAVAAANSAAKANLKVPELTENPQIQRAKMVPTAAKPCVICGLKRDERVARVDYDVEDSFGEWWVDYWGHRACKNFWTQHEEKLRQR